MPEPAPASSSASSVPHFSGGVGYDERARMEAVKAQFNLRLLFAVAGEGSYLSGVRVTIKDAHGATQLDTIANGPWFYAQLPPGFHVLTLDNQGQIQQRKVTVPAQGAVVENFYWQGRATSAPEEKTNGWAVRPAPVKPPHFVPAPGTVGQVPHLSGGVGDGDRAGMEAVKDQYNLRLRFSIANSEADVPPIRIRITDEGGRQTLLETQSQGPWFYAKLPPRQYLLHLNYRGQVQERKVAVPGNGAVGLSFDWDR
jgi:hypothetical protein